MKRFSWNEMKEHWKEHSSRWSGIDFNLDPDGLGNVLHAGAPLWVNEYYARYQRVVFEHLFSMLPPMNATRHALDIGCGAGRWSRFLTDNGCKTTGVDLQPDMIKKNCSRHPDISFLNISIQDYFPKEPFDLISTVTVIQHNPFEEQEKIIGRIRELVKTGGHVIALENIYDQAFHVFSNSIPEWKTKFKKAGFECKAVRRYDYSPFIRLIGPSLKNHKKVSKRIRLKSAVLLDTIADSLLVQLNLPLSTIHCGFLFQAI